MQARPLAVHRTSDLIGEFRLLRPRSVEDAVAMLDADPAAVPLAGGLDVVNWMKEGRTPGSLVMLTGIAALRGIGLSPQRDAIDIAAMTRHDELARDPLVLQHLPDLATCWDRIANIRIRMQGTVAGNVLAGNPGYDGPALLAALGAGFVHAPTGTVEPIAGLVVADGTMRASRTLVTAVRVPLPGPGVTRRLYYERSLRYALSVALCLDHADGRVRAATAVLGGCYARPVLRQVQAAGLSLAELHAASSELAAHAFSTLEPPSVPWFGANAYREHVAPILLRRLLEGAAA